MSLQHKLSPIVPPTEHVSLLFGRYLLSLSSTLHNSISSKNLNVGTHFCSAMGEKDCLWYVNEVEN